MASDPEELLRSIERTREELANTVDTIAGRLDPKRAAKRGVGAVRDGVTTVDRRRAGEAASLVQTTPTAPAAADAVRAGVERRRDQPQARFAQIAPVVKRVPKPAAGGMAALARTGRDHGRAPCPSVEAVASTVASPR